LAKGSVFAISALACSVEGSGALGAICAEIDEAPSAQARATSATEKEEERVIQQFSEAAEALANAKYVLSF
jgi:hypothetical protein